MPNDFNLRFGSNSEEFADKLVGDLKRAEGAIASLKTELASLDTTANNSRDNLQKALGADLARRKGGGNGNDTTPGNGNSLGAGGEKFFRELNDMANALADFKGELRRELGEIVTSLGTVPEAAKKGVESIRKSAAQQIRLMEGRGSHVGEDNVFRKSSDPRAVGQVQLAADKRTNNIIEAALRTMGTGHAAPAVNAPGGGSVSNALALKEGFDRVVNKLDTINQTLNRVGLTTPTVTRAAEEVRGTTPSTPAAQAQRNQAKATAQAATATDKAAKSVDNLTESAEDLAALDSRIAQSTERMERLAKAVTMLGGGAAEQAAQALEEIRQGLDQMKADRARVQRETTGISSAEQKEQRRREAEANRAPDLPEKEFDDRMRRLGLIEQAAGPLDVGRGKGKVGREQLRAMADAFSSIPELGIGKLYNSKTNMQDLAGKIGGARQSYDQMFPAGQVPESLRTGRRLVSGKISDYMHSLLGEINTAAAYSVQEETARNTMRQFGAAGGAGMKINPHTGLPEAKVTAGLRVTPGMPSQAFGPNQIQVTQAAALLDARRKGLQSVGLQRAIGAAGHQDFNPFDPGLYQHITKGNDPGDETGMIAMRALAQLKESTRALDQMGDEFRTMDEAAAQNEEFIDRANNRLERSARGLKLTADQQKKLATDPENIAAAQENVNRIRERQNAPEFAGLHDLFRSGDYAVGRARRAQQERENERASEAAAAGRYHTQVRMTEASGSAIAGARLAPGTAQTYVRNTPGLLYNRGRDKYVLDDAREFADSTLGGGTEKDRKRTVKRLEDLNRAHQAYNASLAKEQAIRKAAGLVPGALGPLNERDTARMDKAGLRTENKATSFLNAMQSLIGVSPSFESVVDRKPTTSENIADELDRQRRNAKVQARADKKFAPPTDVELAAQRAKDVARTEKLLQQADKELTAARTAETKAVNAAKAVTDARSKAERDAIAARQKASDRVGRLTGALPGQVFPDVETPHRLTSTAAQPKPRLDMKNRRDMTDEELARYEDYREYQRQHTERLAMARQDLAAAPKGPELTPAEQAAADKRSARVTAEAHQRMLAGNLERAQSRSAEAQANIGGKDPEVATLQKRLTRSQNIRRELTRLRADVKKAIDAEDAEAAQAARDELNAYRKKNLKYRLSKPESTALRARIRSLQDGGDGEGAGGGGGGGRAGGSSAAAGGGGSTNSLLRQILAELKSFHASAKGGLPIKGKVAGEAAGETAAGRARRIASPTELARAASGDPEQEALAAVAQQRRLRGATSTGQFAAQNPEQFKKVLKQAYDEQARSLKGIQREQQKSTESDRQSIRSKQDLARASAALDSNARRELDTLRQLHQAHASDEQIVEQQTRAYLALEKALSHIRQPGRQQLSRQLLSSAGPNVSGTEIQGIARSANAFKEVDKSMAGGVPKDGLFGENSLFTKAMFGNSGFWSRVMSSTGTFVVRNFTAGFVFGLTNALQEIVRQGIITESTFIRVSDALEQTGRDAGNLRTQLQGISSQYGTNLEDVYQTAAGLVGLFDNIDDIAGATKVVSQLQSISMGALNAQEAMGVLASITGAYGDQLEGGVDGLGQIADVLTVIQNVIGTNIEVTSEGVGRMSGLSRQLKIDFQDTAVYVAQIAKLTNQTGGAAGEQFSRILASMQSGRGRAVLTDQRSGLKGTGIEELLGSGQYGAALKVLMQNWDGLTDSQKRNITTTLAGQRQAAAFAALMNNSTKVLNAQEQAHNANGQAAQRAAAIANTLNGQITRLTSNLQNLAQNLVRTGLLNFFGLLLKVVNASLSAVNHLFSVFNDVADSNPALKMLKDFTGTLIGLIVTLKLGGMAFRGFKASLAGIRGGEGALSQGVNAAMGGGAAGAGGAVFLSPAEREAQLAEQRAQRLQQRTLRAQRPGFLSGMLGSPYGGAAFLDQRAENLRERAGDPIRGSESQQRRMAGLYNNTAKASNLAAGGLRKVGSGMSSLASLGGGAQLGIGLAIAAITAGLMDLKKGSDQAKEARKLIEDTYKDDGTVRKASDKPYVGPLTQKAREIKEDNSTFTAGLSMALGSQLSPRYGFNLIKERYTSAAALASGQINKQTLGGLVGLGTSSKYVAGRQGVLSKGDQDALTKYIEATKERVDAVDTSKPNAWRDTLAGNLPKNLRRKVLRDTRPKQLTYDEALQLSNDVGISISDTRDQINKSKMTDQQKLGAQAQLEQLARDVNTRIAKMILVAQGVAKIDMLSTEQLATVDQTQSMFAGLATSGGAGAVGRGAGGLYGKMYDTLIADTGARANSKIGRNLQKLSEGGLSKAKAFTLQGRVLDEEIQQLQAQYLAATTSNDKGLEPEEIDALKAQMLQAIQARAALVQARLDAFAEEGNALSAAAAGAGNYTLAGDIAGQYANKFHRHRDLPNESDLQRAQNDMTEAGMAQNQATQRATAKNQALEASKASTYNSQTAANLDVQITKNTYDELLAAQKSAQEAGRQGPAIEAIAAARNAYFGSLKSQQQQMDQIAQATRQAAIAAIPQGNATAVARAQVANARASLAEAEKYGHASTEYQGALAQLYAAQQQATSAQSAVRVAQAQMAVAYAEARGDTVGAAHASERVARAQLAAARKASGGAQSADVLAARAQVVQARAATRDAILNDRLETIDFNLQMGKITQSSAIAAMRQILRTANLTKQQRRDLLLKIKGMKDELADGPWNFGEIGMPTPYQMRRYVKQEQINAQAKAAGVPYHDSTSLDLKSNPSANMPVEQYNDHRTVLINGADTAKVRAILTEILGKSVKTRTAQGRRR